MRRSPRLLTKTRRHRRPIPRLTPHQRRLNPSPTAPLEQPYRDRRADRKRTKRRVRRIRRLGAWRRGGQAHLLRPLCVATPWPRSGGHRRRRRFAGARVQGPRAGQPGLRRADPGSDGRPRRNRPLPLLHQWLHHMGERPAGVPQHRRRYRRRARSQRQPGQWHRLGHPCPRSRALRDARCTSRHDGLRHPRCAARPRRCRRHAGAGRSGAAADGAGRVLPDIHG
jgi:hypothetical protein